MYHIVHSMYIIGDLLLGRDPPPSVHTPSHHGDEVRNALLIDR